MKKNLRKEKRISADILPEELSEFFVSPYGGPAEKVTAVNASYGGFGFAASGELELLTEGTYIKMYPYGITNQIRGQVVYKFKEGVQTVAGIQIIHSEGYQKYFDNLKNVDDEVYSNAAI